jgi:hypothetical protein
MNKYCTKKELIPWMLSIVSARVFFCGDALVGIGTALSSNLTFHLTSAYSLESAVNPSRISSREKPAAWSWSSVRVPSSV